MDGTVASHAAVAFMGQTLQLATTISPLRASSGAIVGAVATCRDVSHEAQLEAHLRQAQKMEAIGTLAGGVAHDFNNILSPILGYAELLEDEFPQQSQGRFYVEEMQKAASRAKQLVQQILTFSRQSEQERKPMRLEPVVREVVNLLRGSLPATIEIRDEIRACEAAALADSSQIHQVVMNLCTNAFHAMEDRGGVLTIGLDTASVTERESKAMLGLKPGGYCCITVADTGVGMPPETVRRVFEPYFTTKEEGKGTGLGLATVHGIVQAHGGSIDVYSEPGAGTRFNVYFPLLGSGGDKTRKQDRAALTGDGEHVLVIDDERPVLRLLESQLTRLGYKVTSCSSGTQALHMFHVGNAAFDLVLTDRTMPKMTGTDLASQLVAIDPEVRIILMTGMNTTTVREEALASGIRAVVGKPVEQVELSRVLRSVLDGRTNSA